MESSIYKSRDTICHYSTLFSSVFFKEDLELDYWFNMSSSSHCLIGKSDFLMLIILSEKQQASLITPPTPRAQKTSYLSLDWGIQTKANWLNPDKLANQSLVRWKVAWYFSALIWCLFWFSISKQVKSSQKIKFFYLYEYVS